MNETMGKLSAKSEKIRIWMDVRSDDSASLPQMRRFIVGARTTIGTAAEQAKELIREQLFVGTEEETFSLSNLFRVRTN